VLLESEVYTAQAQQKTQKTDVGGMKQVYSRLALKERALHLKSLPQGLKECEGLLGDTKGLQ
jgi:hypothetical protein